jgi:molecular chaperone HtpG
MSVGVNQERFGFQAEVVQLLDLMVHSLYSNKEIFLRELISNASDAADRLRFEALSNADLYEDDSALKIRVAYDKDARTITISDNGIGMSRQEVIDHIGTIAKSGTREFFEALTGDQRKDARLIGEFGVGFYSAFIVAGRVTLDTRRAGLSAEEGVRWESDGRGEYLLETIDRPDRGTEIVLHLREGEDELLNGYRLRSIVTRYSDHISLPIVMPAERSDGEPSADAEGSADETINRAAALWVRAKSEITDDEYNEFYKHVAHDYDDPLARVHSKMEGTYEYTLLLYIPSRAPYDLGQRSGRHGVKLYVRRVFIMDDAEQLLPHYLRFVRGIVDSSDLPLNVSREILQSSRLVESIRSGAVRKVLGMLADLASNDAEKYATFWKEFGTVLKEGVADDYGNRGEIGELLRFRSTQSTSGDADVSLRDYVARMKEGQERIYYITALSLATATSSPHLEVFRKKGIEVLLLDEIVDNWVVTSLHEYDGRSLQSVAQGVTDLDALADEDERAANEKAITERAELVKRLESTLGDLVWKVRVTDRLTTSAACIVANEPAMDFNVLNRLRGSGLPSQPVLEINPHHALIAQLDREADEERFANWAAVLYNEAVLTAGAHLDDPAAFVSRLNDLLVALTPVPEPASEPLEPPAEPPDAPPASASES